MPRQKKRRVSDKKPLSTYKQPRGEKTAFQAMVKREYPAVKGELSKRLGQCFYHSFHVNAGEKLFSMIEIFKEAMQKRGADTEALTTYTKETQGKLSAWMQTHPTIQMRRRLGKPKP